MYFTWDYRINGFLFENFNIDSLTKCLLVIIIVFGMAYLTELIKILQEIINYKLVIHWNKTNSNKNEPSEDTPLVSEPRVSVAEIKRRRLINHVIQSLMYTFNLVISYFLMNISMCFYAGHFISIVLGFGFGYFILHVLSPDFYKSISNERIGLNNQNKQCQSARQRINDDNISYEEI